MLDNDSVMAKTVIGFKTKLERERAKKMGLFLDLESIAGPRGRNGIPERPSCKYPASKSLIFCTLIGNRGRRIERRCLNLHRAPAGGLGAKSPIRLIN